MSVTQLANGSFTIGTAGNTISGTAYKWTGFNMAFSGMPASATHDQTMSTGASNQVTASGSQNPPEWLAGNGSGHTYGTASVTITSLGAAISVNGQMLYQSPRGSLTATLVDQNTMTNQPPIMETVSF